MKVRIFFEHLIIFHSIMRMFSIEYIWAYSFYHVRVSSQGAAVSIA
jgi:hypothetical protein